MRHQIMGCAILLSLAAVCSTCWAVELEQRYVDPYSGFSVCPPAGVLRSRSKLAAFLVRWDHKDPQTKVIRWSLTVSKYTDSHYTGQDMQSYGNLLARRLRNVGFSTDSQTSMMVSERPAVVLDGRFKGTGTFWQRRISVWQQGQDFLEFRISGPLHLQKELSETMTAVAGTIRLTNPKVTQNLAKQALLRGKTLLAEIADDELAQLVHPARRWFMCYRQDKPAGFMVVEERIDQVKDTQGIRIRTWMKVCAAPNIYHQLARNLYCTPDRSYEQWTEAGIAKTPDKEITVAERGSLNNERLLSQTTQNGKTQVRQPINVPAATYLPAAMEFAVYRTIASQKRSGQWAFHHHQQGVLVLRTIAITGRQDIKIGGKTFPTICLSDQLTQEGAPAKVYIDTHGNLLKLEAGEIVMQAANKADVLSQFPEAKDLVK